MKFMQTFKGSFHAQTMPITRSKQLVGAQEFARGVIHASTNRSFKYTAILARYVNRTAQMEPHSSLYYIILVPKLDMQSV